MWRYCEHMAETTDMQRAREALAEEVARMEWRERAAEALWAVREIEALCDRSRHLLMAETAAALDDALGVLCEAVAAMEGAP